MRDVLIIEIPGEPVAKGRPRFTKFGRTYTPAKTQKHEKTINLMARGSVNRFGWVMVPTPDCVAVKMTFFMQIPKSWSQKKQQAMVGQPCSKNIDADNLIKAILDGINHSGVWEDDRQVSMISASKYWHFDPSTIVSVKKL